MSFSVDEPEMASLVTLMALVRSHPHLVSASPRRTVEALRGMLDEAMSAQINLVLHHPEWQQLEASWRGLRYLVLAVKDAPDIRVRLLDIGKRELSRTLRKFRGMNWDQSPIFKRVYEEEYGQLGGTPFGLLVGDYEFDHHGEDVQCLASMAQVAAAAHAPFLSNASPALLRMERWSELGNPRDVTRILGTPDYAAWHALRGQEDARYVGLCLPRFLMRLPYGARTDPDDRFAFEEESDGPDSAGFLWANAAWAFAGNVARAFAAYGWCARIRGVDSGGLVEDLPVLAFSTADGDSDHRCVTEIAMSDQRESELAQAGLIPLVYRKNTRAAAFVSAQSLQRPVEHDDPDATLNAALSARLPYLLASCRFAHYLKCMVRDKTGTSWSAVQLQSWLGEWLIGYVDGAPETSDETWKAEHPLADGHVVVEEQEGAPGHYQAKFFLRPHYQLEGLSAALRLVSTLPRR